jgi:hypothetical protein
LGKKEKFEFYDYFILVRFLAFERKKIEKYWEDNVKGKMDREKFRKCTFFVTQICWRLSVEIMTSSSSSLSAWSLGSSHPS